MNDIDITILELKLEQEVYKELKENNMSKINHRDNHTFLTLEEVKKITGLSTATIYAYMHKREFPGNININQGKRKGWRKADVEDWLASQNGTIKDNSLNHPYIKESSPDIIADYLINSTANIKNSHLLVQTYLEQFSRDINDTKDQLKKLSQLISNLKIIACSYIGITATLMMISLFTK